MTNPQDQNYVFDAHQHAPEAGLDPVPAGTYDVTIDDTDVRDMKDNKGWFLYVVFKIMTGEFAGRKVTNNYNIGHTQSPETVRIAHGQLSALCHVTGRFQVTKLNKGAELRGGNLRIQVTNDGTYNQLKGVFDTAGNKPEKAGAGRAPAAVMPVASAAPAAGGWGAPAPAAAAPAPVAVVAAPVAPVAPAPAPVFPPAGWQVHPSAPGYYYSGQEVLTEQQLREKFPAPVVPAAPPAPPAAPAQPAFVPPSAPIPAAAAPAAPAGWNQAPAPAAAAPAPWGAPAA